MGETEGSRAGSRPGPAVVLVRPQLGENIGTAARAMANFGLDDLRLVRPRDGWPNAKAVTAAAGAASVLDRVRLYDTAAEAVGDLHHVYATTARRRFMLKPVVTPAKVAQDMRQTAAKAERSGVLFGPERTGLTNDEVALADAVLMVPMSPAFASLNLAQAVLLVAYAWFQAGPRMPEESLPPRRTRPATKAELENFFRRLERELVACGFLGNEEKRPSMMLNIRAMFLRAGLFEQEVRTLHGMVTELARRGREGPGGDV